MNVYELLKLVNEAGEYRLADIAMRLAAKNEILFLELASEAGLNVPAVTYDVVGNPITVQPHQFAQIRDAYNSNGGRQKVAAIKVARQVCVDRFNDSLGLKEAKDLVEHLMEIGKLPKNPEPPRQWMFHDEHGHPY